jgi:hypothetical protein
MARASIPRLLEMMALAVPTMTTTRTKRQHDASAQGQAYGKQSGQTGNTTK